VVCVRSIQWLVRPVRGGQHEVVLEWASKELEAEEIGRYPADHRRATRSSRCPADGFAAVLRAATVVAPCVRGAGFATSVNLGPQRVIDPV
jgi:hypothetical protein